MLTGYVTSSRKPNELVQRIGLKQSCRERKAEQNLMMQADFNRNKKWNTLQNEMAHNTKQTFPQFQGRAPHSLRMKRPFSTGCSSPVTVLLTISVSGLSNYYFFSYIGTMKKGI